MTNQPRCGCGNCADVRPDGTCTCMCHPANQELEDRRIKNLLHRSGKDTMSTEVRWLTEPEDHDYPAALDYIELLVDRVMAEQVVALLEEAPVVMKKAKDVLRASTLPLLSEDDPHVAKDLHKIRQGHALSPILLARGDNLIIADGYHRVCACYHVEPNTEIPCKLV